MDYIAFFCALKHSPEREEYLLNSLTSYDIGEYLIVRETAHDTHKLTNGQHYHFLVQMNNDDYVRYRKKVFIDHFKLRGQAKDGFGRQYGKINYLKSPDRMAIYMMKEDSDNVVATTMTQSQLERWKEQSFQKSEKDTYRDKVENYIVQQLWEHHQDDVFEIMHPSGVLCDELKVHKLHQEIARYYIKFVRENSRDTNKENPYMGKRLTLSRVQIKNFQNYFILFNDIFKYVNDNQILSLIN